MKVSVIIPAYNEEHLLPKTLQCLTHCSWADEIITVNDGSNDQTAIIAEMYSDKTIHLQSNFGKAYALKQGWKIASGDLIMCLDSDLAHSVIEGEKLLNPIVSDPTVDCVIGKLPTPKRKGFGMMKRRAQKIIYSKTGQWITAPLSGQRVFKRKWLELLMKKGYVGYGVEVAMTIDLISAGANVIETDTNIYHRETGKDLSGFFHRGKQWLEMERTLRKMEYNS
ncbi:glycosyltransferase family 2 protein [Anaerobacillus sp. MEB173]|uniref:glycosyltransferase family 2 protein n=1 Tax=Anaerobacillus sp. MEB173 TaxID=3383345 RepID=UPI003F8F7390